MKVRPKKIWNFRVKGNCTSAKRTEITARGLNMIIDEPEERGGTNTGMMPVEVLMASLAGCTNVISNKIAQANDIAIHDMNVEIVATMDSAGTALWVELDVPFPDVKIHIDITTDASDEKIELLKTLLPKHCAVSKVLQQAGSKVTEIWNVQRPAAAATA